jgi:dienelactone hydrolase
MIFVIILPGFSQESQKNNYDTVTFQSGDLALKGFLWKPSGKGPFPAVLYNHGSELHPEKYLSAIPLIFLQHGYAFFVPFRRGQGLSIGQGRYILDEVDSAAKTGGPEARFATTIRLHETSQLQDQFAALKFLQSQKDIDANKIVIAGMSFGGIQTMLMAENSSDIKAALNFAGAAMMWDKSPEVGEWLKKGIAQVKAPIFFIQAENDFSIKPSLELSEEMKKQGKPYQIKIYPPRGTKPMQGHTFIDEVNTWAPDVFPQLEKWINKK